MKLTDFALIFLAITVPIILVVYINVSYTIKAVEQEMSYKKIINAAVDDATYAMKEVESDDKTIDYGYSGIWDKKVNLNAQIGVNAFFDSLYNNFGIKGNMSAEKYLQLYVPAVVVVDYNGIQTSSIEIREEIDSRTGETKQTIEHVLKPKRYYTYTYGVTNSGEFIDSRTQIDYLESQKNKMAVTLHTIEFTIDDYISHRSTIDEVQGFYVTDSKNNIVLATGYTGTNKQAKAAEIAVKLLELKDDVISEISMSEVNFAINKNNIYAKAQGIRYDFIFPPTTKEDWLTTIKNPGIITFVQGLATGNKKLNYKTYGTTDVTLTTRYYLSVPGTSSKYPMNLYHKTMDCPEYKQRLKEMINSSISQVYMTSPGYALTKEAAASATTYVLKSNSYTTGFAPCPICNP